MMPQSTSNNNPVDNLDIELLSESTEGIEEEQEDNVIRAGLIARQEPDLSKDHFTDLIEDAFNSFITNKAKG